MRSSDWISDVCSSDLLQGFDHGLGDRRTLFSGRRLACRRRYQLAIVTRPDRLQIQCRDDLARVFPARFVALGVEIGSASCRERGCQHVLISVGAEHGKKKNKQTKKERQVSKPG